MAPTPVTPVTTRRLLFMSRRLDLARDDSCPWIQLKYMDATETPRRCSGTTQIVAFFLSDTANAFTALRQPDNCLIPTLASAVFRKELQCFYQLLAGHETPCDRIAVLAVPGSGVGPAGNSRLQQISTVTLRERWKRRPGGVGPRRLLRVDPPPKSVSYHRGVPRR